MDGSEVVLIFIGLILYSTKATCSNGVSVSCMMAYDEGGAPAVFDSQDECFHIKTILSALSPPNQTATCPFFQLQGRRDYQEDRVSCDLHIKFPLLIGSLFSPSTHLIQKFAIKSLSLFHHTRICSMKCSNILFYVNPKFPSNC